MKNNQVERLRLLFTEVLNFFLELEVKEGVGGLQVKKTLAQILTGAGAGSSGWAWSGSVPHHPLLSLPLQGIKGILHQKIFYRLNLIFWIVMECGIAHFGQRGLKTTET